MKTNTKKLIIFMLLVALGLQISGCAVGDMFGVAFYKQKPKERIIPQVTSESTTSGSSTNAPTATSKSNVTNDPTKTSAATAKQTTTPNVTVVPTATPTPKVTAKPTATPVPNGNYGYYQKDGNYITFGSYPQSEVTDSSLKSSLTSAAGNTSNWTSYDYYTEDKVSDFMKYKDVTYNGNKYRGVYFTQYRPYYTDHSSYSSNSYQDDNGYNTNTIYWFKYEPIKWKILTESNGDAFLVADMLLDSQDYDGDNYSNNYANSQIRKWLNSTFYNTAFNSTEQGKIKTTNVDNSGSSTGVPINPYVCSNTNDKIFLLSYKEVTNSSYGFSSSAGFSSTRVKKPTSYAKAQGVSSYSDAGEWLLRSPDYDDSVYVRFVNGAGYVNNFNYAYNTDSGVAPALHLTLSPKVTAKPTATPSPRITAKPTATSTPKVTAKPTATPVPNGNYGYYQKDGNYITFGSYPQSEVTDSSLKSSLTSAAGNTSNWTSYNYYISGSTSSFMKYKDVTYNGNKYRGVYFTQYRPYWTIDSSSSIVSNQDDYGYNTNTIYWFKYEPIKWKILEESNGDAFLVADMLLDSQDYNHTEDNNYANSSIRSWLNSTFYNTAFNSTEQSKIKTTNVRSKIKTTNVDNSVSYSSIPYAWSNTNDKIFLLSYEEVMNSPYGFSSSYESSSTRVKKPTSYAKAQGGDYSSSGSGWWWLRSPHIAYSDRAYGVGSDGNVYSFRDVYNTDSGVAPALHLTL